MVPKLLGVTPHRAAQDLGFYVLVHQMLLLPKLASLVQLWSPSRPLLLQIAAVCLCQLLCCQLKSRGPDHDSNFLRGNQRFHSEILTLEMMKTRNQNSLIVFSRAEILISESTISPCVIKRILS